MTNQRKKLIIVGLLISLVLIAVGIQRSTSTKQATNSAPKQSRPSVVISQANLDTGLDTKGLAAVESALPLYIEKYADKADQRYAATVRPGSLQTQYQSYDGAESPSAAPLRVPVQSYLVDIPGVKQSYQITRAGGKYYPYDNMYVLCPSKNQLKYGDFGCVDDDQ